MVRAMDRRAVMKLSAKCRSGREQLRVVAQRPSGRGGETLHAFSDDERVAAEGDGDVVVPAREASSFEVVEPELALQIFIDTLSAPSLHDEPDELSLGDVLGQGREEVVGRLLLTVAPLDEKPLGVALRIDAGRRDSPKREAGGEILLGRLPPSAAAEATPGFDSQREVAYADRVSSAARVRIEDPHDRLGVDADSVVEGQIAQPFPEVTRGAVGRVSQDDSTRQAVLDGATDHGEPELRLGLELYRIGDARLFPSRRTLGPALRQVELEIDWHVLGARGDAEADANLAVGDLAGRARVLALHADRMNALLEEAGVVEDPGFDGLTFRHGSERVLRRNPTHLQVAPPRAADKVQEPLMGSVHLLRAATHEGGHGLDALALGAAEQAHRVDRERSAALGTSEHLADPGEVALDATNTSGVHEDHGPCSDHAETGPATSRPTVSVSDRNDPGFRS